MKKNTLKKWMCYLLALSTIFALTACGSNNAASQTPSPDQSQETTASKSSKAADKADITTPQTEEPAQSATDESGGALAVYYSATGNTESVVNAIAAATDGDLFELEPVEPYTDADLNWMDDNSRVSVEHDNPDNRIVELTASTVDNWDSYDTVYIGYPIWLIYNYKEGIEEERKNLGALFNIALRNTENLIVQFLKKSFLCRGGIAYDEVYYEKERSLFLDQQ